MNVFDTEFVKKQAKDNFLKGYNCAQSLVLAFKNYLNLTEKQLAQISSPFGGGMCRLRETCGVVSGMLMVLGLLEGYSTPETGAIKADLYKKGQKLVENFEKKFGTISCAKFLGKEGKDEPVPEKRTEDYYKNRPCLGIIEGGAEVLANFLNEQF